MKYENPEMEIVELDKHVILTVTSGQEVDGIPTIDASEM